ncbi:MAG: SPOR domain-containing protein [Candidatus Aegiribacteria sp.]|nr:SPOR domain-containing protein [Candidatus Aegiribacteria sp.]
MIRTAELFIFLILLTMLGCGSTTISAETDEIEETEDINPYSDPPGYTGDPFTDFPGVIGVSVPQETYDEREFEILSGTHFTVQVSAAASQETAERLAESISADITLPVFVDHSGRYWKVRVGAFPAREDAIDYSRVLVDMGFTDAWVTTREP